MVDLFGMVKKNHPISSISIYKIKYILILYIIVHVYSHHYFRYSYILSIIQYPSSKTDINKFIQNYKKYKKYKNNKFNL